MSLFDLADMGLFDLANFATPIGFGLGDRGDINLFSDRIPTGISPTPIVTSSPPPRLMSLPDMADDTSFLGTLGALLGSSGGVSFRRRRRGGSINPPSASIGGGARSPNISTPSVSLARRPNRPIPQPSVPPFDISFTADTTPFQILRSLI